MDRHNCQKNKCHKCKRHCQTFRDKVRFKKDVKMCKNLQVKGGAQVCGEICKPILREPIVIRDTFKRLPIVNYAYYAYYNAIAPVNNETFKVYQFMMDTAGSVKIDLEWGENPNVNLDLTLYRPGVNPYPDGSTDEDLDAPIDLGHNHKIFASSATYNTSESIEVDLPEAGLWSVAVYSFNAFNQNWPEIVDFSLTIQITQISEGLKVKSYLDISEAAIIPEAHPAVGWWVLASKRSFTIPYLLEIKRAPKQANGVFLQGKFYSGTAIQYQEMSNIELNLDYGNGTDPYDLFSVQFDVSEVAGNPRVLSLDLLPIFNNSVARENWTSLSSTTIQLHIQNDLQTAVVYDQYVLDMSQPSEVTAVDIMKKIPDSQSPPGILTLDGAPQVNLNSPVFQFKWFADWLFYCYNTQFNKEIEPLQDSIGFENIMALRDDLLAGDLSFTSYVGKNPGKFSDIWPTMKELDSETLLPENPITSYEQKTLGGMTINVFNIDPGSGPNIWIFDPGFDPVLPFMSVGVIFKLSGARGFTELGVADESVNTYYQVDFSSPDFLSAVPFSGNPWRGGLGGNTPLYTQGGIDLERYDQTITISPLSFRVNHPDHGLTENDFVDINGVTGTVGGLDASEYTGTFPVNLVLGPDFYLCTLRPGPPDVFASSREEAGGNSVTVAKWITPVNPRLIYTFNLNTGPFDRYIPLTILLTEEFNEVKPGSTITVEGLAAPYDKLNGVHQTHPIWPNLLMSQDANKVYKSNTTDYAATKYPLALEVDTSDLPVYDPEVHGYATITVTFKQVKENSEYQDFIGSLFHLWGKALVGTHSDTEYWYDFFRGKNALTWDTVQENVAEAVELFFDNVNLFRTRTLDRSNQQPHVNRSKQVFLLDLPEEAKNNPGPGQINQQLRYDFTADRYAINVPVDNYLNPDGKSALGVRIAEAGPYQRDPVGSASYYPDAPSEHLSNNLATLGYNANGTGLEFALLDPAQVGLGGNIVITLTSPAKGPFGAQQGNISAAIPTSGITGEFILADPIHANTPLVNNVAGKIVVAERGGPGDPTFTNKATNALNAGATAIIIYNNQNTGLVTMSGDFVPIPSVFITQEDGLALVNDPPSLSTVSPTGYSGTIGPYDPQPLNGLEFGIIKDPRELSEEKIGYIQANNTVLTDILGLTETHEFTDDPMQDAGLFNIYRRAFATIMASKIDPDDPELQFNQVDKMIIDIRYNSGGNVENIYSLASFFGDNRPGYTTLAVPSTNGYSNLLDQEQLYTDYPPEGLTLDTWFKTNKTIPVTTNTPLPSGVVATSELYPDLLFQGTPENPKKLVIMTSTNASSGGDVFPHYFRGTKENPNDLGGNVKTILVGNIDGRLEGGRSRSSLHPVNSTQRLQVAPSLNKGSQPLPPVPFMDGEAYDAFYDPDYANAVNPKEGFYANQIPKMEFNPVNGEGIDELMNLSPEETWWQDIGLAPLSGSRNPLPVPDNNDPSTYRDRALETAIDA